MESETNRAKCLKGNPSVLESVEDSKGLASKSTSTFDQLLAGDSDYGHGVDRIAKSGNTFFNNSSCIKPMPNHLYYGRLPIRR